METPHLPTTLPLLEENGHSLEHDMILGWVPKALQSSGPVPLKYWRKDLVCQGHFPTVYYGFCPNDSYSMHKQFKARDPSYSYDFDNPLSSAYDFISRKLNKIPDRRPFSGMAADCPEESLHFDSFFECGNLDRVVMVKSDEYDLYLRPDSNTGGNFQWFYFSVKHLCRRRTVRFNLVNLSRKRSLYSAGKQPFALQESEGEWKPVGENVVYGPSKLNRFIGGNRRYYCLTFDFLFNDPNDMYYFAELPPYSFTKQVQLLKNLQDQSNDGMTVRIDSLCQSLGGLEVPIVTVTDERFPSSSKQTLLIVGRVHPGEVIASSIIEGILRFICSADPDAVILRQRLEVRVVPILNPDGVVIGNSRTSFSGRDLNRNYIKPDPQTHVEIWALKELISMQRNKLFAFIDIHGHSTKKGSFLYGPQFAMHNDQYYLSRVVPKLMSEQTQIFRYFSCKFRVSKAKQRAARGVIAKEFKIPYVYTFENSFYYYLNEHRQTVVFTPQDYLFLGELLVKTLSEFDILLELDQIRLEDRSCIRTMKKGQKVERYERPLRPRLKRFTVLDTPKKLRTVAELIRQIKAEEPHLEVESSDSDTDSSEDEDDLPFFNQALSEMTLEVQDIFKKNTTPSIRVVDIASSSNRHEIKTSLEVRLPSLNHSPTPYYEESPDRARLASKVQVSRSSSISKHRINDRQPTRQVVASQTVLYPLHTRFEVASTPTAWISNSKNHTRSKKHKLTKFLCKLEPRVCLNTSAIPKTPIVSSQSCSLLKLPSHNPITATKSHGVLRGALKRDKNASIYSKFGPFPSLPLMFD